MRHGIRQRKLGRKSGHRTALFRNMSAALIMHEQIRAVTLLIQFYDFRIQSSEAEPFATFLSEQHGLTVFQPENSIFP